MKYRPVPILNVVADTPAFPHGETADSPRPVPSDRSTSVKAQEAIAPARTAAQETPETDGSTRPATGSGVVDCIICWLPAGRDDRLRNDRPKQRFHLSDNSGKNGNCDFALGDCARLRASRQPRVTAWNKKFFGNLC